MESNTPGMFGADQALGQASGEPAPQGTAAAPEQPSVDLDAKLHEMEERIKQTLNASLQKITANSTNQLKRGFDQRMESIEAKWRALGLEVPADVRQREANDFIQRIESEATSAQSAPANAPMSEQMVYARANKIVEKYGITLDQSDPEYRMIPRTADPFEYLDAVEAAAKAKAEKINQPTPTGSRAPMTVQGTPVGGDLRAEYDRRKQGVRPGSEGMLQLRREMRKKGLTDI